jgi:hypothetical protein
MTKTTKSERKWGKKEPTEQQSKPKSRRKKPEKIEEDMYKILVDGSGFTKAMTYSDCQKMISRYESKAKKLNRVPPSLVLVKQ